MSFDNINTDNLGRDLNAQEQKPRDWWSRNWKWCIPLLVLVILILWGGAAVMKFIGKRYVEPYKMTMAKIQANQQVQEALGLPIRDDSWTPSGELNVEDNRGSADLRWDLAGPKGKGKAYVKARMISGQWEIVMIEVTLPDGNKLVLRDEGGANEAPPFAPPGAATPEKSPETAPLPDLTPNIPPLPEETEPKK